MQKQTIEEAAKEYSKAFGTNSKLISEIFSEGAEWALSQPKDDKRLEELRKKFDVWWSMKKGHIHKESIFDFFIPNLSQQSKPVIDVEELEKLAEDIADKYLTPLGGSKLHRPYYIKAMLEFANLQPQTKDGDAVEFAIWFNENRYSKYWGNEGENCGKYYVQYSPPDRKYFTMQELYQIFKSQTTIK